MAFNMSKVRRRDLTSSFTALAAKCEERRNLNCDFGDEQGQDKDRILPRFVLTFHHMIRLKRFVHKAFIELVKYLY